MAYFSRVAEDAITYDVQKRFGVISKARNGWTKEMNLVSWNGGAARYEIRSWSPDHIRMGKGVALSLEEIGELKKILANIEEA